MVAEMPGLVRPRHVALTLVRMGQGFAAAVELIALGRAAPWLRAVERHWRAI